MVFLKIVLFGVFLQKNRIFVCTALRNQTAGWASSKRCDRFFVVHFKNVY
jgi:hypothetical protein